METPNNIAGELTEKIMNRLCGALNPDPVIKAGTIDTRTHNRMYSQIYAVLEKVLVGKPEDAIEQIDSPARYLSLMAPTRR